MSPVKKRSSASRRKKTRRTRARVRPEASTDIPDDRDPRGLLDRLRPKVIDRIESELEDRLAKIPNRLNEFSYDPWGFNPAVMKKALVPTVLFYRYWFRVKTRGIGNLPRRRVLIVGNHAGQIAIDAAMVGTAMILEGEPPRIARGMGEFWLPRLPWFNIFLHRIGGVVGTPKNCVDLLEKEEAVTVFPEGVRGVNKLYKDRYKLERFGLGFMRLALQTNTPIVPVGIVGSEEQAPSIANIKPLAKLLRMPAFPITPTWPLLGPLGLVPLPARYSIEFGKPMSFEGDPDDEDAVVQEKVDQVKDQIAELIEDGLQRRKSVYF